MEKYIGTVVRKSLQLVMVADIHYFENIRIYQKKYTFYIVLYFFNVDFLWKDFGSRDMVFANPDKICQIFQCGVYRL